MTDKSGMNRRRFLGRTAVGTTGVSLALASGPFSGKVLGANNKIVISLIGCGSQDRADMRAMMKTGEVWVAGVCDVAGRQRERAAAEVKRQDCAPVGATPNSVWGWHPQPPITALLSES